MALSKVKDGMRTTTALDATLLSGNLPAISGTNLTNLPAANLTGTLPAISGASLTNLPGGGKLVQLVNATTGSVATGTTRFNEDDTIPQNTEGDEWMSLAITPTSASNKLWIQFSVGIFHTSGLGSFFCGLFQDTTANALAGTIDTFTGNWDRRIELTHYMTSGTTSATTFKIRAGNTNAATTTFNGASGGRYFGGVLSSTLTIMEISV